MTIGNYTELKQAIADFGERGDLGKVIPDFIAMAEAKLNRTLQHPKMSVRATATVATTSSEPEFVDLPTDFQEMRRICLKSVTGHPTLDFWSEGQLAKERARWGGSRGRPTHYTIFGTEMELCPVPDSNYTLEMVYRQNLPALATYNTNWLLTLSPDVYLYGALYHLANYTGEADKLAQWSSCYQTAFDDIIHHGRSLKYGAAPVAITIAGENTP